MKGDILRNIQTNGCINKPEPDMTECAACGDLHPWDSYSDDECNKCLGIEGGTQ